MLNFIRTRLAPAIHLTAVAILVILSSMTSGAAAAADVGAKAADFNIEAAPLAEALSQFGAQSGLQVVYSPEVASGLRSAALSGRLSADDALSRLLAGTGVTWSYANGDTVVLKRAEESQAQPVKTSQSEPPTARQTAALPSEHLEEVLVTAQKREERLQDVPVPVTSIEASSLAQSNRTRIQDYFSSIPGLSAAPESVLAGAQVAIRGVTTGGITNPTVGTVVDDVPYGSSSYLVNGFSAPDLDPGDLARLEVLRGPQGTLYGASSMGGLIKFVTTDPSTSGVSGSVQAGTQSVGHGHDLGYNVRGAVNLPLNETVAIRASAFIRETPGYIDNVRTGERDVNDEETKGGLVSLLWAPSDEWSLKLSALLQRSTADGAGLSDALPGLNRLEQSRLRNSGWRKATLGAYSATVRGELGGAELTSITGYNRTVQHSSYDFSASPFWSGEVFAVHGVTGAPLFSDMKTSRFTQELRLSAPLGERFEGLVGLFYSDEDSNLFQAVDGADAVTGVPVGEYFSFDVPIRLKEYAAFADLTWQATERFDIQFGARQGHYKQTVYETFIAAPFVERILGGTAPLRTQTVLAKDDAFTYLVTPRFRITPDLMVYGRFASGYRLGGPNASPGAAVLPAFDPDTTENYEFGIKGGSPDHRVSFDASVYYIDWQDIQLQLRGSNGVVFFTNASRARSQGIELSTELRPARGTRLAAWVSYNEAELADEIPPDPSNPIGGSGDRLPNSSRYSGNLSLDQEFPLSGVMTASVGGSVSYVGKRESVFLVGSADRQQLPSYTQADFRASIEYDTWQARLFVTNLTDKRGVLSGGLGSLTASEFFYIQPRTIGVTLSKTF